MVDDIAVTGDVRQMRTGFSLAGVVLALLLTGCADQNDYPGQSGQCRVHRDTEMALTRVRDFMLLPATLQGTRMQMVLDTGAEVSTISPAAVSDLRLLADKMNGRVLRGVGGDIQADSVVVSRFALGDLRPMKVRFSVGPSNILPGQIPPVAGLLGADLLDGHDLDLDAPQGRLALYTVANCPGFQPWRNGPDAATATGTAMTRTDSGLSFVVADFDGSAVRALLDTGARTSFMTRRVAASLGVTDDMLEADPVSIKVGISRSEIDVRQHVFARITLGPVTWHNVPVAVADVELPGVDMLLGADLLGRQRVWISPARGMLWLR